MKRTTLLLFLPSDRLVDRARPNEGTIDERRREKNERDEETRGWKGKWRRQRKRKGEERKGEGTEQDSLFFDFDSSDVPPHAIIQRVHTLPHALGQRAGPTYADKHTAQAVAAPRQTIRLPPYEILHDVLEVRPAGLQADVPRQTPTRQSLELRGERRRDGPRVVHGQAEADGGDVGHAVEERGERWEERDEAG